MISLDVKTETSSSSPLSLSASEDEPTLSFSELLKGVKEGKTVKSGSLILALDAETKDVKTLSKKETKESKDTLELHPKIVQTMSDKEIKTLVADAKEFLKTQILQSDGYKKAQVKDLPKTIGGLAEMAKKFGIDVSKITIEEVKASVTDSAKTSEVTDTKKVTQKVEVNTLTNTEAKIKDKTSYVKNSKAVNEQETTKEIKENVKLDDKKVEIQKEVKSTPLFKAQDKTQYTTEELVQTKQFKVEEKTPKQRSDETLKLLLRGEKPSTQLGTNITSDFSVATARVIAPQAKSDANKSLEQLLRGNTEESISKTDGLNVHKSDSFEVKLNEAKQMIKYLSQDVKTAIEDYKSPFTRVKVQLNPQKLGEIDLTVVQRGKNLHVNLSSNNAAINTLSMNANELRAQLNNNGINNATLNFNNQDSSQSQAGQQEQHRQREQHARDEYSYFENEEESEEILSSLEIIVPNYA